jgi:hypothetical protein
LNHLSATQPIKQAGQIGDADGQEDGVLRVVDEIPGTQADTHPVLDKIDMHIHTESRLVGILRIGPVMVDGRRDSPPREKGCFFNFCQIKPQDPVIFTVFIGIGIEQTAGEPNPKRRPELMRSKFQVGCQ